MTEITSLPAETADPKVCPNLIAVASGKGGVGKTWLSAALTHALAGFKRKALLFDGDLGLANVDIQLGLTPERDLGGVMAGRYPLSKAVMKVKAGRFDAIAGRSGSGNLASLPANKLIALSDDLAALATRYDDVVLDLGAGIERTVRHFAQLSGTCLVVTTDEPTALTDAYAFIKLAALQDDRTDLRIVINMAGSKREGERTYGTLRRACESFLQLTPPLAGVIPRDPKVKDSIRHQMPILTRHPAAPAAKAIDALARTLRPDIAAGR
ncbi:MAG: MinD/ParA family protein [Phycisphaerales bacterium JB039]